MVKIPYRSTSAGKARPIPPSDRRRESYRFLASDDWQRLRRLKLNANPLCERCESKGLTVEAVDVHHIEARSKRPDLALVLENLESLCKRCHTLEENARRRRGQGWSGLARAE